MPPKDKKETVTPKARDITTMPEQSDMAVRNQSVPEVAREHPAGGLGNEAVEALSKRPERKSSGSGDTTNIIDMNPAYERWNQRSSKGESVVKNRWEHERRRMLLAETAHERMQGMNAAPVNLGIEKDAHGLRKFAAEGVTYERVEGKWTTTGPDGNSKEINANIYERSPQPFEISIDRKPHKFDQAHELHIVNKDTGVRQVFYEDGRVLEQYPNSASIERVGNKVLSTTSQYYDETYCVYKDGKLDSLDVKSDGADGNPNPKVNIGPDGKPNYEFDLTTGEKIHRDENGKEFREKFIPEPETLVRRYDNWGHPAEIKYQDGLSFEVHAWDIYGNATSVTLKDGKEEQGRRYDYNAREERWISSDGTDLLRSIERSGGSSLSIKGMDFEASISDRGVWRRDLKNRQWSEWTPRNVEEGSSWSKNRSEHLWQLEGGTYEKSPAYHEQLKADAEQRKASENKPTRGPAPTMDQLDFGEVRTKIDGTQEIRRTGPEIGTLARSPEQQELLEKLKEARDRAGDRDRQTLERTIEAVEGRHGQETTKGILERMSKGQTLGAGIGVGAVTAAALAWYLSSQSQQDDPLKRAELDNSK